MLVYEPIPDLRPPNIAGNNTSATGTSFSVTIQALDDVSVLHCTGRITVGGEDVLHRAVGSQPLGRRIVLDLADVAIDAAGLGALVSLRGWAVASGTELKLMNL